MRSEKQKYRPGVICESIQGVISGTDGVFQDFWNPILLFTKRRI